VLARIRLPEKVDNDEASKRLIKLPAPKAAAIEIFAIND
jgi:hypothetical protein